MKTMKINIRNYFDDVDYSAVINEVLHQGERVLTLKDQSINVILVDDEEIQSLNLQYREKDYATDVLTFPDGYLRHLGDVFISLDKCREQALAYGHSFDRELGFLTVHGLLHTLGYDHQTTEEEQEMNRLQETILQQAKLFR